MLILTLFTGCTQIKGFAGKIKHKLFDKDVPATTQTAVQPTDDGENSTGNTEETTKKTEESKKKKLVVALNATLPPYEYYYGDEVAGIDVDIAKKIAGELGREIVIKDVPYTELFDNLTDGTADIVISAVARDDYKGVKSLSFSDVYNSDKQSLVIRKKEEKTARIEKISSIDDLKGLRIGVLEDSTSEFYARYYFDSADIEAFDNYNELFSALVNNAIDGVVAKYEDAKRYLDSIPDLKFLDKELRVSDYRIISADEELVEDINKAIEKIKKNGTIKDIIDKYYSETKYQ